MSPPPIWGLFLLAAHNAGYGRLFAVWNGPPKHRHGRAGTLWTRQSVRGRGGLMIPSAISPWAATLLRIDQRTQQVRTRDNVIAGG